MSGEFDPAAELGLFPDKTFICSCRGFITKNDSVRDLCERFIRNGGHFYDVLARYDDLTAYVLGREEATGGRCIKWAVPFLKAFGATDHLIKKFSRETMEFMPNAARTMGYISKILPTFISSSMYEHTMMEVMDALDAPLCEQYCSQAEIDQANFSRTEARKIRDMAEEITALRIPKVKYELNVPMEVDEADVRIIKTLDSIFQDRMPELSAMNLMESISIVTAHKKAYQLLDIRRQTNIDLDSTFCIGGDKSDFQTMDLVKDSGGMAISYNGSEYAVRGCNIAILSKESTAGAVFAAEFYDKGLQAVLDLASNWERSYLKKADVHDTHLMETMLAENPRKLPEVFIIDKDNVDEISEKSDAYRKKILGI